MGWMQRLMYGRHGLDPLGLALAGLYLLLNLFARIIQSQVLAILSMVCGLWMIYRIFSRQLDRRRAENAKFMEAVRPIVRWYNVRKCRRKDKDHCYFKCPNCGQQLRVPKGKGKISITCRSCGASFEEKT